MKLQRRRGLDTVVKDAYWAVVLDCLTDLFQVPTADAARLCLARRTAVELAPPQVRGNIFYHREPFDVAADLAESDGLRPRAPNVPTLADPGTSAAYEHVLGRHGLL